MMVQQRGFILIGSLIVLALLAMLSASAMKQTLVESQLSQQLENNDQGLQGAAAALRQGERQLRQLSQRPTAYQQSAQFPGSGPKIWQLNWLHPDASDNGFNPDPESNWWQNHAPWWQVVTWNNSNSQTLGTVAGGVTPAQFGLTNTPRYVIEHEGFVADDLSSCSYGSPCQGVDRYRITARALTNQGGEIILQSYYVWRYPAQEAP